jgi:hypothetical protein
MSKKVIIYLSIIFLLALLFAQGIRAAGEVEYVFEKTATSFAPIYMSGHDEDPNWIEGFNITVNISLNSAEIGTASLQVKLLNPPVNMTEVYDYITIKFVNNFTGIGTFEVTGLGVTLGSSTTATAGDMTFAWSGSISNGTGSLANIYGLSSGTAIANIFTGEGSARETIRIRFGY